jgi:DNA gyrase/topoisomerase IV subunit B
LCEELRRLEELMPEVAPAWARVPIAQLIASFDGTRVPMHWAEANGQSYFFDTLNELNDFLELEKAKLHGNERLRVFDSPDREFARENAHVVVCHLTRTEDLAKTLSALEKKGLAFRGGGDWQVVGGKEVQNCTSPLELAAAVRKGAQSDIDLQRYKGLGEMDAEQLWESTMDPARRTLYQVKLDDAMAADEIFTILMSDGVEQRREYIEKHALEVTNLDV